MRVKNKRTPFIILSLVLIVFAGYLLLAYYLQIRANVKQNNAVSLDMIDQRMSGLISEIHNFPSTASGEILVLSDYSAFLDFIEGQSEGDEAERNKIEKDFLQFIKQSPAYYELRYLDRSGQEVIKVNHDGSGSYSITPRDELANKADQDYFQKGEQLKHGQVLISRLDLNVKNGRVENRGTDSAPEYVPVIYYSTPVSDGDGRSRGVVVASVYADYFLDDVRAMQRGNDKVFLIDSEGYYLANADRAKEYGFTLGNFSYTFFNDYPDVAAGIAANERERRAVSDKWVTVFDFIYPQQSSFEIYKGSNSVELEDYFWLLVSMTPAEDVQESFNNYRGSYIGFLVICLIFVAAIFFLAYLMGFKNEKK